jgi:hypothetical protein
LYNILPEYRCDHKVNPHLKVKRRCTRILQGTNAEQQIRQVSPGVFGYFGKNLMGKVAAIGEFYSPGATAITSGDYFTSHRRIRVVKQGNQT